MDDVLTKPRTGLWAILVPVIFANGEDDDLPGLTAALHNKAVQYEKKIYKPGENIEIYDKSMVFNCRGIIIIGSSGDVPENQDNWTVIRSTGGRHINIRDCCFEFTGRD